MNEMASLKEAYPEIAASGAEVMGISADSVQSHESFAAKLGGLPFPLASDSDCSVIDSYGVLNDKGSGAQRSVFVLEGGGRIVYANLAYKVSDPSHLSVAVDAVLGR